MARRRRLSSSSTQTEITAEVSGLFHVGQNGLPGQCGPYPGPWFQLIIHGQIYRGRYVENHVWADERGRRFSELVADRETARNGHDERFDTRVLQEAVQTAVAFVDGTKEGPDARVDT